jgi:hypothetical protein
MSQQNRLGDDRPDTSGPSEANKSRHNMNEKQNEIEHSKCQQERKSAGFSGNLQFVRHRLANGDVAPKRILGGPLTQFEFPSPRGQGLPHMAIDPVRNILIVHGGSKLLLFDRTANGNVKPRGIIGGPKTMITGGVQGNLMNAGRSTSWATLLHVT